jgi:arylsulfatase A
MLKPKGSLLPFFLVGLGLVGGAGQPGWTLSAAAAVSSQAKPNIIFIMADDLGYAELGCYGQKKIRTPHLDQMAAEGLRFTQFYAGSPVCAPSRCVLLTGKHTGHAYIRGNDEWPKGAPVWQDRTIEGQRPLLPNTVTLPRLLQKAGYVTGAVGKWGLGATNTTGAPWLQGVDYFFGYLCQRQAHNHYPTHLWRNDEAVRLEGNTLGNLKGRQYALDLMAEECLAFIRKNKDRPFFLYVPFHVPHVALQVPDDSLKEYEGAFPETPYDGSKGYLPHPTPRAAYAAMITRMDRDVGRILDLLKSLNLEDTTLVMFTSDNGPTFNGGSDSQFFESAGLLRGLKASVFEGGIRVPLIARWPGKIKPGGTTDLVSAFWDVLPTLSELTGARVPSDVDGISFLPTLLGRGKQKRHDYLYWEYPEGPGSQALRIGPWKGVRLQAKKNPNGPIQLFNLDADLGETTNVAARHPDWVKKIERLMKEARVPSPIPYWNYGRN